MSFAIYCSVLLVSASCRKLCTDLTRPMAQKFSRLRSGSPFAQQAYDERPCISAGYFSQQRHLFFRRASMGQHEAGRPGYTSTYIQRQPNVRIYKKKSKDVGVGAKHKGQISP
ncbi:hypothetical protein DFS34DRAFT_438014 [Phlyctochytrium arcticum]|nr:hypothetical protein DFS34DRAFT_438014 [Phlyctochytrium arcticum]